MIAKRSPRIVIRDKPNVVNANKTTTALKTEALSNVYLIVAIGVDITENRTFKVGTRKRMST